MNGKPTLELSPEDSLKLFQMILNGAKPADIFETFDPDNAHYYIKAGAVIDVTDSDNIIAQVIRALGGEMPEIDPMRAIPPGMDPDCLEAKLISEHAPPAVAVMSLGRKGEKGGFGFDEPDHTIYGVDDGGEIVSIGEDGSLDIPGMGGESKGGIPEPIKRMLTAKLMHDLTTGGNQVRIKVGKVSIKGGDGEGVNIELTDLEMQGPDQTDKVLTALGKGQPAQPDEPDQPNED